MAQSKRKPLIVIIGETASGKSTLALQLAQRFNGEIICADAYTVRKEANIGTAKPSKADQQLVKHHLLDIIGPNDKFNAAKFKVAANNAIKIIYENNKLPIMVGGSGLYIDSFLYDYQFLSKSNYSERNYLNSLDLDELVKKLKVQDIDLTGVDLKNKHRLVRLLETNGRESTKSSIRENTLIIGLDIERDKLKKNIALRLDKMLESGLEAEVKRLVEKYGWEAEALKGIGYREWQAYLDGSIELFDLKELIKKDGLDLARRQKTWFRRNKSIQWIKTPVDLNNIADLITTHLET